MNQEELFPTLLLDSVDLHDPEHRSVVEQTLRLVDGVLAVRLVPGYDRAVDEAHAIVELDKSPKHAVRDLQSVLMASFDIPTDHRVFSIVQLGADAFTATPNGAAPKGDRVSLSRVALVSQQGVVEVEVEINGGQDGPTATGKARGAPSEAGRLRAAAEAALQAIGKIGPVEKPQLEATEMVTLSGSQVALALIRVPGREPFGVVIGSAPVRLEPVDAMVRACLDAMNRILTTSD